jgi:hypothetical protein
MDPKRSSPLRLVNSKSHFILFIFSFFSQNLFSQDLSSGGLNFEAPKLEAKAPPPTSGLSEIWNNLTPSFETRMFYLLKESPEKAGKQGFSIMQANVGVDWQVAQGLMSVFRYNLGFLAQGTQELYLDYQNGFFDSLKIGRFPLTFALKLMDHRVYTKKFMNLSLKDFESGVEASKEWKSFKFTTSLVQGRSSGEAFQQNKQMLAPALDLKWDFENIVSGFLGASAFYTFTLLGQKDLDNGSMAAALYYKIHRSSITHSAEFVFGQKRNNLVQGLDAFVGNTDFANNLKGTSSAALYANLEYAFSKEWKSFYEYNQVVLDIRFRADRFEKHALGARWGFYSNSDLELRFEKCLEGRNENPDLRKNNDAILLALHAWF